MSVTFFLVIATFWVVKPIKRGAMLAYYADTPMGLFGWTLQGAEVEQLAKIVNMVAAFVVVVVFTSLVRRFSCQKVIWIFCGFFAIGFPVFGWLVDSRTAASVWGLYVYGDIFNTAMVALFWAFMNDLVAPDEAKRLYGIVGLGGVVGGFVGATVVSRHVEDLGRAPLLAACVLPLAAVALLTWRVGREREPQSPDEPLPHPRGVSAALEGARLVVRSRYLIAIATLLGLYEVVSNIVDFQLAATIEREIAGDTAKDAFLGMVGQITNMASIAIQLVVTSLVMRVLGVGAALMFLPIAILVGSIGFLAMPTLVLATAMSASDNALNYSINQSAKEALYVPTTRDAKYKAKAFIDMFLQRTAKVLAVGINLLVAGLIGLDNVRWLALVSIAALTIWLVLARALGRSFDLRSRAGVQSRRPRGGESKAAVPSKLITAFVRE